EGGGFRPEKNDGVNGSERGKMGWTTVIRDEDRTKVEQMQEIGECGLAGEIQHALTLHGLAEVGCLWSLRRYPDNNDIERFVHEEASDERRIAGEGPFPDADPRTGVGVDDHELCRAIDRCMPFL